jgi:hypothetical protein
MDRSARHTYFGDENRLQLASVLPLGLLAPAVLLEACLTRQPQPQVATRSQRAVPGTLLVMAQRHKPTLAEQFSMTTEQAEQLFKAYQEALGTEQDRGSRRSLSLLPAPKETVMRAVRLLLARLYYQARDTEDELKPLIQAAMFIDSFSNEPFDSVQFVGLMQSRRRELAEFYRELMNIRRTDQFFWQRVYAITGLASETKRTTFFDHIRSKLGVGPKPESPVQTVAARR